MPIHYPLSVGMQEAKYVYLCNQAVIADLMKSTTYRPNITCKNCLRILKNIEEKRVKKG